METTFSLFPSTDLIHFNPYEESFRRGVGIRNEAGKRSQPIYYHNTWNECAAIHWDDLGLGYLLEP